MTFTHIQLMRERGIRVDKYEAARLIESMLDERLEELRRRERAYPCGAAGANNKLIEQLCSAQEDIKRCLDLLEFIDAEARL